MTALSTHDTKRGEDVRARLAVLAEVPDAWARFAERLLASHRPQPALRPTSSPRRSSAPVRSSRDRMHAYAEKAMREASDGTTWTEPDEAFEADRARAVDAAYDGALRADWDALTALLTAPGWSNSLGPEAGPADHARRPGRLPGHRAAGRTRWSTRTTVARSTSRRAAACSAVARPAAGRRRDRAAKLWWYAQALRARARAPGALRRRTSRSPRTVPARTTWWPSTAVVPSRSPPGCPRRWPRPGVARHDDHHPGRAGRRADRTPDSRGWSTWPTCSAPYPVALLQPA